MDIKLSEAVATYFMGLGRDVVRFAKSGESALTLIPAVWWALGVTALAFQVVNTLFRRFLFRRVPLWELMLQDVVFIWLIVHGIRIWFLIVHIGKLAFSHYGLTSVRTTTDSGEITTHFESNPHIYTILQLMLWNISMTPLAIAGYIFTRPRNPTPLVIWIAASPWQRRELGTQGYYLNRPPTVVPSTSARSSRVMRRSYSDSDIFTTKIKRRKVHKSKSI